MTPAFHDAAAELAQARELLPVNTRAAGAVCGVALERALQAAAGSGLESIGRLSKQLRDRGVLTPELHTVARRIAHARARCVHAAATPPTLEQIECMIARAYQVVAALAEEGGAG